MYRVSDAQQIILAKGNLLNFCCFNGVTVHLYVKCPKPLCDFINYISGHPCAGKYKNASLFHDPNDFEVGLRHNLEIIKTFTEDAHIVEGFGKYSGLDRYEARKAIVADLEAGGYLLRTEDYKHNVGTCYRCGTTVEPMVSKQWFVKMEPLAKPAIEAVRDGHTKFVPERFDKTYYHWMENIKDWCISRQLWWGHRIPAYYCRDCGEMIVSKEDVKVCPKCGSTHGRSSCRMCCPEHTTDGPEREARRICIFAAERIK